MRAAMPFVAEWLNSGHQDLPGPTKGLLSRPTIMPQRFATIRQSLGLTLIGTAFSKCLARATIASIKTTSDRTTVGGPSLLEGLQRPRTYLWLSSWGCKWPGTAGTDVLYTHLEFTIVVKPVPGSLRRWPRQWHMNGELRPYVPMELAMVLSFKDAECTTNWTASLAHPLAWASFPRTFAHKSARKGDQKRGSKPINDTEAYRNLRKPTEPCWTLLKPTEYQPITTAPNILCAPDNASSKSPLRSSKSSSQMAFASLQNLQHRYHDCSDANPVVISITTEYHWALDFWIP